MALTHLAGSVADAQQQRFDANVFVQLFPVKACSAAADDAVLALLQSGVEQAGEIGQRDAQHAAVVQFHPQTVMVEANLFCKWFSHSRIQKLSTVSRSSACFNEY